MYHGVINVYKERGYTSHDAVAKLRGILRQKKIGHTGTLDPEAEGVLPVCLGVGTRICDLLTDSDKVYRAVLLLGQSTDTQDATGTVLKVSGNFPSEAQIEETLLEFVGAYEQIPPMYSALKVNGKKLYELARQGKTVERKARPVQIYEIKIEKICLPRVTFTVSCSKGTYIRTLCHDAGEALGCGGCMEELTRVKAGGFSIENSLTLSQIEELYKKGRILEAVTAVDEMFGELPAVRCKEEADRLLYNGNALAQKDLIGETDAGQFRLYDSRGNFCALYRDDAKKGVCVPVKMFLTI